MLCTAPITVELGVYINYIYAISEQTMVSNVHTRIIIIIIIISRPSSPAAQCYTRMWAYTQYDGRPAEYRWRPLFNTAKFG